ncbi:MAG: Stp1/IreP family PP2C-type Ser/Thr phosphatase [Deltaproteobacteria bacterium]|nr:Stp1/IreP family PP2C-type Ser/Thr phosphatase [Deltaproteobacteria bacterium]
MRIRFSGQTDVGRKRQHNEDAFLVAEDYQLALVCDGMGGHNCGEVASSIAVDEVRDFFKETQNDRDFTWPFKEEKGLKWDENRLVTGVKLANQRILDEGEADKSKKGMGTTLVAALFKTNSISVAHVGDSRCYRFRDGKMELLTEDHSLLNEFIRRRKPNEAEIARFPHKNVICRALGLGRKVIVDVNRIEGLPGDLLMLCSDGLNGMITDAEILDVAKPFLEECAAEKKGQLDALCEAFIDAANEGGGKDNITCICVQVL